MEAPKCRICEKRHYGLCPVEGSGEKSKVRKKVQRGSKPASGPSVLGMGSDTGGEPAEAGVGGASCVTCGADAEVVADAQRWRNYRDKKRAYMKVYRSR